MDSEKHSRWNCRRLTSSCFLCATNLERLEAVAEQCRELGAEVDVVTVEISSASDVTSWATTIGKQCELDLLIMNAGVFGGVEEGELLERLEEANRIVSINLDGCINCAASFAPSMIKAEKGRMVFVSSLAAFSPLADAPAYSASKAGLTAYATALRELLAPHGVGVTIVHPGHIETDQTRQQIGGLHFVVSAEHAAKSIAKGLKRSKNSISFPWQLSLLVALSKLVPERLRMRFNHSFRFKVSKK